MAKPSYEELVEVIRELREHIAKQDREIAQLKAQVEELRRAGKRQAAPFSKGEPKKNPRPPGRKSGNEYGRQAVRPRPRRVDETVVVQCPLFCNDPGCGGRVRLSGKASQYQVDIPEIRPRTTEFVVQWGRCVSCGRRAQGRDPRQVSDALEVGAVHLGPGVVCLAGHLNKVGGLSYGKIATLFEEMLSLRVARSTLCRALQRLARRSQPTYQSLIEKIRGSPVVYPDETGWRIGGRGAWLWAFTNRRQTVYTIERGRGYAEAASVLGQDFSGVLGADGWAPYRLFKRAEMQTCLAHLLRRTHEILETAKRGSVRFPREVAALLLDALDLRDRRRDGTIGVRAFNAMRRCLVTEMDRLLAGRFTAPENRRFAAHLRRNRDALFLFLEREDVEATNWPAEQAIRPAVVNRKSCGGNRTQAGATTQAVLMSILRTCHQQRRSALRVFTKMLRSPQPRVVQLAAR